MDFKKCSEVYGYKSIAEVEEEELEAKLAERNRELARKMLDYGDSVEKNFHYNRRSRRRNPYLEEKSIIFSAKFSPELISGASFFS